MAEIRETHQLHYSDASVEVHVYADGDISVQFLGKDMSFDKDAWLEVTEFVQAVRNWMAE